jgi:hypothetical protein
MRNLKSLCKIAFAQSEDLTFNASADENALLVLKFTARH